MKNEHELAKAEKAANVTLQAVTTAVWKVWANEFLGEFPDDPRTIADALIDRLRGGGHAKHAERAIRDMVASADWDALRIRIAKENDQN